MVLEKPSADRAEVKLQLITSTQATASSPAVVTEPSPGGLELLTGRLQDHHLLSQPYRGAVNYPEQFNLIKDQK